MLYPVMKRVVIGPALHVAFRPRVIGLDNIPESGPAILAGNHLAFVDSLVLPLVVPRRISFVGKAEYFNGAGVRGRLRAGFFRGVGTIPIDRAKGRASEAALLTGLDVLRAGELFGIYPEGTRSPDGRLYRGRTGIARLVLRSGAPVVPFAMVGTDDVQPPGRRLPRPGRVEVRVGSPLDFSRYAGMPEGRFLLRSITDEVMYAVLGLSGQDYVDVYASMVKAADPPAPAA